MKTWIRKGMLPVLAAVMLLSAAKEYLFIDSEVNYLALWLLVGLPFGFGKFNSLPFVFGPGLTGIVTGILLYAGFSAVLGGFIASYILCKGVMYFLFYPLVLAFKSHAHMIKGTNYAKEGV